MGKGKWMLGIDQTSLRHYVPQSKGHKDESAAIAAALAAENMWAQKTTVRYFHRVSFIMVAGPTLFVFSQHVELICGEKE